MGLVEVTYKPRNVEVEVKHAGVGELVHCLSRDETPMVVFGHGLVLEWSGVRWAVIQNPGRVRLILSRKPNSIGFTSLHPLWCVIGIRETI